MFYDIGNCVPYIIKTLRGNARDAQRKAAKAAVHRRTKGRGGLEREKKMSGEIRRVKRELAYEGTVLKVYKDYMEFENGGSEVWDYIHHNGAAAVLPVLDDGRVLLVSQYRSSVDRDTLEIPAGKLDYIEEPMIACAGRELEEETGYKSDNLERLLTIRTTVALCNEKIDIYVAKDLKPSRQHLDEGEYVTVSAYTIEELKAKIFAGEIEDSKTIAAVFAYADKCASANV